MLHRMPNVAALAIGHPLASGEIGSDELCSVNPHREIERPTIQGSRMNGDVSRRARNSRLVQIVHTGLSGIQASIFLGGVIQLLA